MQQTLIAFPYAGANSACYRTLGRHLGPSVQLVTHELPGRGTRGREKLCRRLDDLIDDAVERLTPMLEAPFAFYGHSFGAWLARGVTQRLSELGQPLPTHLVVSGSRGPLSTSTEPVLHRLPSALLLAEVIRFGGTPRAVLEDPDLMGFFERLLRADLEALETSDPSPGRLVDLPIHVLLGEDDHVTLEQALAWQRESTHPISLSRFPGGHFFIHERVSEVAHAIGDTFVGTREQVFRTAALQINY